MGILILLVYAGYVDYRERIIPTAIVLILYVCTVLFSSVSVMERIAGFLIPALPLFLFALKWKSLKGGDIKYLSAVGAYFGLTAFASIMSFAALSAVIWGKAKKKKSVPLALFIAVGYVFYLIWRECVA